jgi:8-oxo-dGTP pyrophosphatase MutT (NUDIX family)
VLRPASSRTAYQGPFARIDVEEWPELGSWEILVQPGAVAVLPITPTGDVLLVRQLRPAVRTMTVEIPAGLMDVDGEDAVTCAARELFEETGYRHQTIEFLGGVYVAPGVTNHFVHVFWALTEHEQAGEPETGIELLHEPLATMLDAARAGRVQDAKTALALLLLGERRHLREDSK